MGRPLITKFCSIALIALLILIPLTMIKLKISERAQLRQSAENSVAASWTAEQTISGPMVVIDYEQQVTLKAKDANGFQFEKVEEARKEKRYLMPFSTDITADINAEIRKRGIYPLRVYTSKLNFSGEFDTRTINTIVAQLKANKTITKVSQPRIIWTFSDPRGLNKVSELKWDNLTYNMSPGTGDLARRGVRAVLNQTMLAKSQRVPFEFSVELRGMNAIYFLPRGRNTQLKLAANWPHPKFSGAFLPSQRDINAEGFTANWEVNEFASSAMSAQSNCVGKNCNRLKSMAFGVELVNPVDVYLQSERAAKYGFLFVLLIFVGFVMFELLKKLRIHPVQYALVGVSIAMFFLLLISLSEHLGFNVAYLSAASASLLVIVMYLRSVLQKWQSSLVFGASLTVLYGLLFLIIQSEDYALLMGSLLCFSVLAAVMMITRGIDWYELGRKAEGENEG